MDKRGALLILVILLPCVSAGEQWMYHAETIDMGLSIGSTITITPQTNSFHLETLNANLTFIPKDSFQQEVNSLAFTPSAFDYGDHLLFVWERPASLSFSYGFTAELSNRNIIPEIRKKIAFPIKDLDPDYEVYVAEQTIIDFADPAINKIASELVAGEDDLYFAVFAIADWVMREVEYRLDVPSVAVGTKSASWVINNRIGVCDEMTTLFMAMIRSLGIPARYVSGLAYTNQNGLDGWGPHAWAEVYFPGIGWIPYDVTYGEFGYVDATHIKLMESLDADESSTSYSWKGRAIDFSAEELSLDVELLGMTGAIEPPVALSARFLKEKAGFGSYNLLAVEVTNTQPYYVATEVALSRTLEMDIEEPRQSIAIAPKKKKTLYFVVRISDGLDRGYIYTIPTVAYTTRNVTADASFASARNYPVYRRADINQLHRALQDEGTKTYSKELVLDCSTLKEEFIIYENVSYACLLKNLGNIALESLDVCLGEDCRKTSLGIGQQTTIEFVQRYQEIGEKELLVSAKNDLVARYDNEYITVVDEPIIAIQDIEYPSTTHFSDEFQISFLVSRKSVSIPVHVDIRIEAQGFSKDWNVNSMDADQKFIIRVKGRNFGEGANDVKISVDYEDDNGKKSHVENTFKITLSNVTFFQKLLIGLYGFENWAMGLFSRG